MDVHAKRLEYKHPGTGAQTGPGAREQGCRLDVATFRFGRTVIPIRGSDS